MEKSLETSPKTTFPSEKSPAAAGHQTQPQNQPIDELNCPIGSAAEIRKTSTPDRLNVPKPFKYPERYTSPTDLMMSPVSKGLLARSRKTTPLLPELPPTKNQHQTEDSKFQEVGLFANLKY